MSGFDNEVIVSIGERLEPSTAQAIGIMQQTATDVSRINYTGNPEGAVSANPSSLCHDPSTGIVYYKFSGTGNTGWIPIFQPLPNKLAYLVDDFMESNILPWVFSSLDLPIFSQDGHPGLYQSGYPGGPPFSPDGWYLGDLANPYQYIKVGSGILSVNYVISLNTLSLAPDDYIAYYGLTDTGLYTAIDVIQNGIWFSYTDTINAGNWTLNTASAGVTTATDSGVPATTDFVNLGFRVNAAGTSIDFFIDHVACGTITTNIPSVNTIPFMSVNMNGTNPGWIVDLFSLTYLLTNTR